MISKKAKYAIKTLLHLSRNKTTLPVSAKLISEKENIPFKFLEQILRELKQHKIVKSERGMGGGYFIAKDPEKILLVDILRIVDGPIAYTPCVSLNFYEKCDDCVNESTCNIRKIFEQLRDKMLPILEKNLREIEHL